jgi:hypothetical protein
MKKVKLSIAALLIIVTGIKAQEATTTEEFVPSGKPSVRIFTNAHSTFIDGYNTSAFQIQRAYFGYSHNFSENFSTKIILDVGDPGIGKLQMTAFLKNAELTYKKNKFTSKIGVIGLYGFKLQEKHWGYRYLYKSFQDEHRFGSSADLGVSFAYKFSNAISVDLMILNGEGYKVIQTDDTYKGAFGVTITPVKNLNIRAYYDLMSKEVAQQTLALFAGYKADKFKIGAEYNYQKNHFIIEDHDFSGASIYSTVSVANKFNIFGRFDNLTSTTIEGDTDPWNISKDGQQYILGFEYNPVKGVKIAPNFQGWSPNKNDSAFEASIYLNIQINL